MGKAAYGLESVRHAKRPIYAIVYDQTLGGDALKRINAISQRGIPIVRVPFSLTQQFKRDKLKLIGIEDKSLANAIITAANDSANENS